MIFSKQKIVALERYTLWMKRASAPRCIPALAGVLITLFLTLHAHTARLQSTPPPQAQEHRSVWDGIYTEKQADRGERLYRSECVSCHGDQLTGKESENSPALTGKTFEDQWNGRTVGDLFRKILRKMPQDDPGRLTPQESADLVAFLLRFNKFPSGKTELPPENELLAVIHFDARKPDQKRIAPRSTY